MEKKQNNVDISIIVPIYNSEKYLKKCIDSLINQTYKNIEIILINDGSKDNSEKIIKTYSDKRIKYISNQNQGIGKTRNEGIRKSTGEYIMFIDSDDYIKNDCCEKMIKKAHDTDSDLVVSDFYKDINGKIEPFPLPDFNTSSLKENKNLLLKINLGPCNKLYKSELIKNNHITFDETLKYEDVPFVVQCIKKANRISKINEPLSYYCIHSGSETTVRDDKIFDIIKIVNKIREEAKEIEIKEQIDYLTVDILTNYTIQQRYQKDKNIRNSFINECFNYLEKNVKDYKNKKYYNNKSYIRRKIESNKIFTKIYCSLMHFKYNRR